METIKDMDMFPYFYAANFIHKSNIIRDDSYPEEFSREHPFASYISTMIACFAGSMLSNGLLGLPVIDPWSDTQLVLLATIMWYLVNFSPFDIFHGISLKLPAQLIIGIMVEMYRCNKIYEGINLGFDKYNESAFIILSIGTISGNGIRFIEMIHRLVRGLWSPEEVEFMMPSCDTRASFVASLLFWKFYDDITPCIYTGVLCYLLVMKFMCISVGNPYSMVENLIYKMTIGAWASFSGFLSKKGIDLPEIEIEIADLIPDDPMPDPIPDPEPEPEPDPSPCSLNRSRRRR